MIEYALIIHHFDFIGEIIEFVFLQILIYTAIFLK